MLSSSTWTINLCCACAWGGGVREGLSGGGASALIGNGKLEQGCVFKAEMGNCLWGKVAVGSGQSLMSTSNILTP